MSGIRIQNTFGNLNRPRWRNWYPEPQGFMAVHPCGARDAYAVPMYYVYILLMSNGQIYTGFTHDLRRRIQEHESGGNITTQKHLPIQLIFYEAYCNEDDARRRELYFKTDKGKTTLKLMLAKTLGTY